MGAKYLMLSLPAALLFITIAPGHAASTYVELNNNPFSHPEIKIQPVRQQPRKVRIEPEKEIVIKLEATLVSGDDSMVIANGALIAIGEKIEGLKLLEVREGEAIFAKGRKTRTYKVGEADDN